MSAPHEPPAGRVLHGWGQFSGSWTRGEPAGAGDAADLRAYERAVAPATPAMLSFYVAPVAEQVETLLPKLAALCEERGPFVVLLGLWLFDVQESVARGAHDAPLRRLASGLREIGLPVLLRIGYEFNNPWQRYEPSAYVAAFRHVAGLVREVGACRVTPVWHASTLGLREGPPDPWDPGDAYAAWWGLSLFHHEEFASRALERFLDAARSRKRPVVIAETAPVLSSRVPFRVRGPESEAEADGWYAALFELLRRRPEIKAVSFIALDWRRLRAELPGFGWPDTRLERWPRAAARVRRELAALRFLHRDTWRAALAGRGGGGAGEAEAPG